MFTQAHTPEPPLSRSLSPLPTSTTARLGRRTSRSWNARTSPPPLRAGVNVTIKANAPREYTHHLALSDIKLCGNDDSGPSALHTTCCDSFFCSTPWHLDATSVTQCTSDQRKQVPSSARRSMVVAALHSPDNLSVSHEEAATTPTHEH